MKRLIVTADDFGLTAKINQGIIEAHRHGIITSTSLLANGVAFDDAVTLLRETPSLGVGVHLNLTEGSPLLPVTEVPSLVDHGGVFRSGPGTLARRIVSGKVRLAEIEKELRAQIERILETGLRLTHLDGHKHIQLLPPVLGVTIRLAVEYRIKAIRCAVERLGAPVSLWRRNRSVPGGVVKQFLRGRLAALLALAQRSRLDRAQLQSPEHLFGVAQTGFLDRISLRQIIVNLPEGTSELMCHPGYVDGELRQTPTRLLAQREQELAVLLEPKTKQLLADNCVQLINYGQLSAQI